MLKIWGRVNSNNVRKVLWIAEEIGLDYEHIPLGGAFGGLDDPAFRKMNPNGLVPCIDDEGFVLWESNTIIRYLAAKHGKFWPADPALRAVGDKWTDWANGSFLLGFRDVLVGLLRTPPEKRDHAAIERAFKATVANLTIVDQELQKMPYLSGQELGLGDIAFGGFAYSWFGLPAERPDFPALAEWYERLTQRPAYQKAVMTPNT